MSLVILGGGISGLLAAYTFKDRRPTLIEQAAELGGTYTKGGLKYVRATANFEKLLIELGMEFTRYTPQGGLLMNGLLYDHPAMVRELPYNDRVRLQQRHWMKTRGTLEGFRETCMNDPMGEGSAVALRFDHKEFIQRLAAEVCRTSDVITGKQAFSVQPSHVDTEWGTIPYSHLITTVPLSAFRSICDIVDLEIPQPKAQTLSVAFTEQRPVILPERAEQLDYVYTMDCQVVHRISRVGKTWQAESNGEKTVEDFEWALCQPVKNVVKMMGHLIPFPSPIKWPENVAPLGRFAEWDSRSEAEKTLDRSIDLKERWL